MAILAWPELGKTQPQLVQLQSYLLKQNNFTIFLKCVFWAILVTYINILLHYASQFELPFYSSTLLLTFDYLLTQSNINNKLRQMIIMLWSADYLDLYSIGLLWLCSKIVLSQKTIYNFSHSISYMACQTRSTDQPSYGGQSFKMKHSLCHLSF